MMHIGVFAKLIEIGEEAVFADLIQHCRVREVKTSIIRSVYNMASGMISIPDDVQILEENSIVTSGIDYLFSLGGDGTLLQAAMIVGKSGIPIVGINLGRLGFLASIERKYIGEVVDKLLKGDFRLENRSLLHFISKEGQFKSFPYALNDMTLVKRDNSSMVVIHATLNGEFLNSYWADGLILSTATGSTGYNMSCGGPILMPTAHNFIITPIAPHNLNVRPLVMPDDATLEFRIEGRTENFLCTLDSRYEIVSSETKIKVQKAPFYLKLVQLPKVTFMKTMRDKLMWGRDLRNYKK